ncbi:ComEA family DNA-binding protein [Cyclobacterium jeungdonense]|uniref:Helix-hairpin-helix domain-containing protein n=1 Tax=Cyclobacterium jeungdonense TaxID=708087 RepID=A0ABT8C4H5_9BACT|nr:helix-hairpin-helix domain-containing protein [Cyclobacterium jeungdonense]MDN3686967.1 helix-hairpin-helix domain-containing protein [Cyclobacterium jeungdonense]
MVDKLFYFLKTYLGFTRKESRGFVFVIPMLAVLYAIPYWMSGYFRSYNEENYLLYLEKVKNDPGFYKEATLKSDTVSIEDWPQEEKGKKEDKPEAQGLSRPETPKLNSLRFPEATAVELQMVSGVGPVLSARIESFRDKLGGFHSPEQLLEVYGIDGELAGKIYELFPFQSQINRTIKINEATFKDLVSHPYIGAGEAKVIIAYRNQHGSYEAANDLLGIKLFTEEWVDRIAPYLSF